MSSIVDHLLMDIGKRVQESRKKNGWSVLELAHKCELSSVTIGNIERGNNSSLRTIYAVARALGIKVSELVPDME